MGNPYSLVFGLKPNELISRNMQTSIIYDSFMQDPPSQMIYEITGVRGSGKTVFMTDVARKIAKDKNFIIIELNPESDLLQGLAAKLSSDNTLAKIFQSAKINLSFFGIGLEVSGVVPITNIEVAITEMLKSLKKKGKKVLVTIDEVTNTKDMRIFASAYQIFIRQDLPLYLLMTGLYENIYALQDEKNLTFLYRAPKIELSALNIGAIKDNYKRTFSLSDDDALEMAKLTKGYSFAFQVLGYHTYECDGDFHAAISSFKQDLEDYSYEKIWSELSAVDRKVLAAMTNVSDGKIQDIREALNFSTNQFNPYRKRLIKKGLITGDERGYVHFTLPLFDEFVKENC